MTVYGFHQAQLLLRRELDVQQRMSRDNAMNRVLNIPLLMGPVGGGKTSMGQDESELRDLHFSSFNCGELSDPADFGIPIPQRDPEDLTRYSHMEYCLNEQALDATKRGVFLFFDDLPHAPPQVQGAFLSIAGSRMFRNVPLHADTLIMAAGNRIGDDMYANEVGEAIRTRMTIIEMEPDLTSFTEYGKGGEINDAILGYLRWKPEHLNQPKQNVNRFPCPRGWWEASRHMDTYPDPVSDPLSTGAKNNWQLIVSQKCGDHVGNDFWAWFKIIQRVNVEKILKVGTIDAVLGDDGQPAERRMAQYAAIYAVSQYLAKNGIKPTHLGLEPFIANLAPEMQVAFAVQMPPKVLGQLATVHPQAANLIMQYITRTNT